MELLLCCFNYIDILTFILLGVCSLYSWKIYCKNPAKQVIFLFVGFLIMTFLQIGFIAINYIPLTNGSLIINRFIAEIMVMLRALPITFIMIGIYGIYKEVKIYLDK
jgi:hypothetical protein